MASKHRLSSGFDGSLKPRVAIGPQFRHEALTRGKEQVRLLRMLRLDGAHDSARLVFEISTHELDDIVPFYAISYTWGQNTEESSIVISGRPLYVFKNCYDVLRQVLVHYNAGDLECEYIWIDSVCINQSDDVEKGSQVSIMADIYSKATSVLAYLGLHSEEAESVFLFEHVKSISDLPFNCTHAEFLCDDCQKPWVDWVLSLGRDRLNRLCIACSKFGNREYWKRVWIIQETAKATSLSILCGGDMLSWKPLHNLEQFLALDMDEIPRILNAYHSITECEVNSMHDVFAMRRESVAVSSILSRFSESLCKDPRDRVYGLLSLFEWPEGESPIMADYTISSFVLAEKVARYFFLGELRDILSLFKVKANDPDVERAAVRRRQLNGSHAVHSSECLDLGFRPLPTSGVDEGESLDTSVCVLVVEDQERKLTAALIKCDSEDDEFLSSNSDATQDDSEQGSEDSEIVIEDVTSELVDSFLSDFAQHKPEKLMLGSEIAGYMSKGTQKGDILVPLPAKIDGAFLILRQSRGELYDIVGQAILLSGFELGVSTDHTSVTSQSDIFEARVELRLSSEDAALLFAQDMAASEHLVNPRGRCLRVVTSVTSRTKDAARITLWSSLSASEAAKRLGTGALQKISASSAADFIRSFSQLEPGAWYFGSAEQSNTRP